MEVGAAMTCPHGYPSPRSCLDCMDDNGLGAEPNPPETVTHLFAAMFPGQCPVCDLPIDVGDQIAHTDRDRYIHDTCTGDNQ